MSDEPINHIEIVDGQPMIRGRRVKVRMVASTSPLIVARLTSNPADDFLLAWSHTGSVPALSGECPLPATPTLTPTPTPTPTATPNPDLTYYEQFKGIMFWAIYNETNANQTADMPSITGSNYTSLGDHRYLMARAMLYNIPLNNVSAGLDYMERWKGSIGNKTYETWTYQGVDSNIEGDTEIPGEEKCTDTDGYIGFYKDQTGAGILRWFNGYADCFIADADANIPEPGGELNGVLKGFEAAYDAITFQINQAIGDHLLQLANPVEGAGYVKNTTKCFVWERDSAGITTSCNRLVNMVAFCAQVPNRPGTPLLSRDCQPPATGVTPPQQLNLSTTVWTAYATVLGLYTPDQPIVVNNPDDGTRSSGQGCENRCNFLVNEGKSVHDPSLNNETPTQAWVRHWARFDSSPGYVPNPNTLIGYAHVLRTEPTGAKTWITFVFQTDPP